MELALERAIKNVCEFKQRVPYYYLEWSTKKSLVDGNAAQCDKLLSATMVALRPLLKEFGIPSSGLKKCTGASYYPRQPWIGIFSKGEKPNDGVYPVISFAEDGKGVYVGCTESHEKPQEGFREAYCKELRFENQFGAMATGSRMFAYEEISAEGILHALRTAYEIWKDYRSSHKRFYSIYTKTSKPLVSIEIENSLRGLLRKRFSLLEMKDEGSSESLDLTAWWRRIGHDILKKDMYEAFPEEELQVSGMSEEMLDKVAEEEISKWLSSRNVRDKWLISRQNRTADEDWYDRIEIKDIYVWLKALEQHSTKDPNRLWVFRGQGDADWKLETGLGLRTFVDGRLNADVEDVLAYEHESMKTFRREISKSAEYAQFGEVDLLALMQHYGTKTRLLDFSLSPLVALFMALDQHDIYIAQAELYNQYHGVEQQEFGSEVVVWMLEIKQFAYPGFDYDLNVGLANSNAVSAALLPWWRAKEIFHEDAERILKLEGPTTYNAGIDIVFPKINSARISSQEGLFLMPRRMDYTFHANLKEATLRAQKYGGFVKPVKYVFPRSGHKQLRRQLEALFVTSKTIYPDLVGLAQSLNSKAKFCK